MRVGCPSKLFRFKTTETGTETSVGTIRNKTFVSVVLLLTETENFSVLIEPKQTEEQPNQFDREHILVYCQKNFGLIRVDSGCFGLFRFVSKQFLSVQKQGLSMFRLNRNKQKTNRSSLIESIF